MIFYAVLFETIDENNEKKTITNIFQLQSEAKFYAENKHERGFQYVRIIRTCIPQTTLLNEWTMVWKK